MTNKDIKISLPKLSIDEMTILQRYLTESHHFSGTEWQDLRQALTKLNHGIVQFGAQPYRFSQFYRTFINGTYAYPFLQTLEQLSDIEQEGLKAQAVVARQIWEWLQNNGIQAGKILHAEYLISFCLAQWGAFARGHIFETSLFVIWNNRGLPSSLMIHQLSVFRLMICMCLG